MRLPRLLLALLGGAAIAGCEKNAVQDITAPVPAAAVRFLNFGVNAPGVHFWAGDRKLTGTTSASCQAAVSPPVTANDSLCLTVGIQSTTGVTYSNAAAAGQYVGIDAGQHTFTSRITATTDQGTAITSTPFALQAGKFYSHYVSGIYSTATKTADAFVVEDALSPTIDWTTATVRFVNAISNSQPMTLYATNTVTGAQVTIGGEVAYKSAGAFTPVPPGLYDLRARYTGSATDRIVRTGVPFQPGYTYTMGARGDMTVTSTTATNRPILDLTRNR